jgi:hypothetical protein
MASSGTNKGLAKCKQSLAMLIVGLVIIHGIVMEITEVSATQRQQYFFTFYKLPITN